MWDIFRRVLGHCPHPVLPPDDPEMLKVKGELRQAAAKHEASHRLLARQAKENAKSAAAAADALETLVQEMMGERPRQ
jgi:hypothetical protein